MENHNEIAKAKRYCWDNGIKITPIPLNNQGTLLKICIDNKGRKKIGEKIYDNNDVYTKINELYMSIYNKQL